MSRNDPTELTLVVHGANGKAILCSETGECKPGGIEPKAGFWLPRQFLTLEPKAEVKLARFDDTPRERRGTMVLDLTIPEWLAVDRGLI